MVRFCGNLASPLNFESNLSLENFSCTNTVVVVVASEQWANRIVNLINFEGKLSKNSSVVPCTQENFTDPEGFCLWATALFSIIR